MPDVTLQITIPEEYQTRVINAFTLMAGARLELMADKSDIRAHYSFVIEPQGEGENLLAFGTRFVRELGKAVVDMVDLSQDEQRYRDAINAVPTPSSDVPNDILT